MWQQRATSPEPSCKWRHSALGRLVNQLGDLDILQVSVAADSAFASKAVADRTIEVLAGGGYEVESGQLVRRPLGRKRWHQTDEDGRDVAFASAPLAELAPASRIAPTARIVAGVPMPPSKAFLLTLCSPLLHWLLNVPALRRRMALSGGHSKATGSKST
jgi:hypothetical protein